MAKELQQFILKWKRNNKSYQKSMKTEEVLATFEGLVKGFAEGKRNQISIHLAEIIPFTPYIIIDFDCTADVNSVYYWDTEKSKLAGVAISGIHTIVWAVWNGYCLDGEQIDLEDFTKCE